MAHGFFLLLIPGAIWTDARSPRGTGESFPLDLYFPLY